MDYLETMPTEIPRGRVLVHNSGKPTRHLGARGFRGMVPGIGRPVGVCPCEWSGLEHYRVTPREP